MLNPIELNPIQNKFNVYVMLFITYWFIFCLCSPVARPVTVSSKEVKQEITAAENEPTIEFPASKVAVTDDLDWEVSS